VSVTGKAYNVGTFYDKDTGKTVGNYYMIILDGNPGSIVVACSQKDYPDGDTNTFSGKLVADDDRAGTIGDLTQYGYSYSEANARLYQNYVDGTQANDNYSAGFWAIPFVIFALVSAFYIYNNNKSRKRLARYGDLAAMEANFDYEYTSGQAFKAGKVTVTPHWIFGEAAYNVFLMPLSEVVWMYKQVIQRRTYGIPTGKNFNTFLAFSDGSSRMIPASEENTNMLLGFLGAVSPGTIQGFSREFMKAWKKNPAGFIDWVQANKPGYIQQMQQAQPMPQVPQAPYGQPPAEIPPAAHVPEAVPLEPAPPAVENPDASQETGPSPTEPQ